MINFNIIIFNLQIISIYFLFSFIVLGRGDISDVNTMVAQCV